MRKLAWFVFALLIVALVTAVVCWQVPPVSSALYSFGVDTIGLGLLNLITGGMTGMMLWGSQNLAQSVAVISGILIAGSVLWLVLLKRTIWPKVKTVIKPITPTVSLRGGPEPELPQTIDQVKPVEVKEETPA